MALPFPSFIRVWGQRISSGRNAWLMPIGIALLSSCLLDYANPAPVEATANDGGPPTVLTAMPYKVKPGAEGDGTLTLNRMYSWPQNTSMFAELQIVDNWKPSGCVEDIHVAPFTFTASSPASDNIIKKSFCGHRIMDLSPYLHEGGNTITLEIHSDQPVALAYIGPMLFGTNLLSTIACMGFFIAASIIVFSVGRRAQLTVETCVIAIAGMGYFALQLHLRSDMEDVEDIPGHIAYIRYMAHHWSQPYLYNGWEGFHPPLYYFIASRVFELFSTSGVINPLMAVRLLALLLYMTFCIYGLRTLHEAVESKALPYYVGCLLIVFWPVGAKLSTSISNDIAVYALWSPAFYYLARWFRGHSLSCLWIAIMLVGVMFMVKSTAVVMLGCIGSSVLYALYLGWLPWRDLWRPGSLLAWAVLLLGMVVNVGKIIYKRLNRLDTITDQYLGTVQHNAYPLSHYLSFDFVHFIEHPFLIMGKEPGYLNYFLKTALYGFTKWPNTSLPSVVNVLMIIFLLVTLSGAIVRAVYKKNSFSALFPYGSAILFAMTGDVAFTMLEKYIYCQNFRYVFPMLVPLVIVFVAAMESFRSIPVLRPLYWLGIVAGIGMPALAFILYI